MIEVASKGGTARAASLTKEERSAIASKAAKERWARAAGLPRETHTGILKLGNGIPCSVLDNGLRVFSANGLERAFEANAKGKSKASGVRLPPMIAAANIRPFVPDDLLEQLSQPVQYRSKHGGRNAMGYEATIIRKICDVLLDARSAGVLRLPQLKAARAAESLVRAFADVGIVALVDEATGYQSDRARDELQRLVEAYVVEDMRPWVGLFPSSFFRQVYRIHGWHYKEGVTQGPRYVGKFINRYVYKRLPAPVLERLRELNPVIDKRRRHKHFQFLSDDIGEPTVDRHLAAVTALMSVASDSKHFHQLFIKAFPKPKDQLALPDLVREPTSEPGYGGTVVDGVVIDDGVGSVRERVMASLQERDAVKSTKIAQLVYGDSSEATMSKLRVRLGQYRRQGLIETPRRGYWRLKE